jgi:hypothetical protein
MQLRAVTSWAAVHAAEGGHVEVLQWLRQRDARLLNAESCAASSKAGHFEVVRWLRERDVPWVGSALKGVRLVALHGPYWLSSTFVLTAKQST